MSNVEQINKAVAAHGMWKARLRQAIDAGKSDFTPAGVSVDNQCEFGKWLYSLPAGEHQGSNWQKVHDLHAKFHREASRVLGLAVSGKKAEADEGLATGSPFAKISLELTGAMIEWKKAS